MIKKIISAFVTLSILTPAMPVSAAFHLAQNTSTTPAVNTPTSSDGPAVSTPPTTTVTQPAADLKANRGAAKEKAKADREKLKAEKAGALEKAKAAREQLKAEREAAKEKAKTEREKLKVDREAAREKTKVNKSKPQN